MNTSCVDHLDADEITHEQYETMRMDKAFERVQYYLGDRKERRGRGGISVIIDGKSYSVRDAAKEYGCSISGIHQHIGRVFPKIGKLISPG